MGARDIERALDALYAVQPEKFVEARDAQVKALKDAGDKDGAAQLKAAHKPTQQAHALNRVPRDAPQELEALFVAGAALASGRDFKSALERERAAVEALRKKVSGPDVPAIVAVLRGALADAALAEQVKLGRFSKLPDAPVGFFGAAPAASPQRPAAPAKAEAEEAKRREKARQAEEAEKKLRALAEAEEEAARLASDADAAELAAKRARQRAKDAADKVRLLKGT